jgi:2-polyprenyl-6-methoxyphenol hydroxylase-like FAD-dependent oxidoreductase
VTAIFDDGTSETGNMLIGADGSRSKVRQFLVGDEAAKPQLLPFTFINYSNGKYTAEQAKLLRTVHPIVKLGYHPENQGLSLLAVLDNPDPTKPELTKFQILQSWRGPPYANELSDDRERLKYFKYRAGQFCEPFRTAALALGDESVLPINQGQQWKPIWWDNRGGKVTLVGDAAHSMLPRTSPSSFSQHQFPNLRISATGMKIHWKFETDIRADRGQGLNNAILDSAEIVNAVKAALFDGKNLKEEIDKYEAEMRPRATKEVELALQTAEMSADWEKFTESPLFKLGHNKDKM